MSQSSKLHRWLSIAAPIQIVALLIADVVLTRRLGAIFQSLRDSLYAAGVATEQVDKVNQTLFAIATDTHWLMMSAILLSIIGFGLLIHLSRKRLGYENSPLDREGR
jgi:hypothetical protein